MIGTVEQSQIVGVSTRLMSVTSSLQIPISSSTLPTQKLANISHAQTEQQVDKQQIYDIDARNPQWKFQFKIKNQQKNRQQSQQVIFNKMGLIDLFQKLQQIQDKLDAYA